MKCLECRGACCEALQLGPMQVNLPPDGLEWLKTYAARVAPTGHIEFEVRCSKLTTEGLCGIYETRPLNCRLFPPGSGPCLLAVKRRRTPEDYQRIRDAEDPQVIHAQEGT